MKTIESEEFYNVCQAYRHAKDYGENSASLRYQELIDYIDAYAIQNNEFNEKGLIMPIETMHEECLERHRDTLNDKVGDYLDSNDALTVSREIDEYADSEALWSAQRSLLIAYREFENSSTLYSAIKTKQEFEVFAASYCKLMNEAIERKLQQD
jgi:hypothetical protein